LPKTRYLRGERVNAAPLIAVGVLDHESNSFSPVPTPVEDFAADPGTPALVAFERAARCRSWATATVLNARATASAPMTAAVLDRLMGRMVDELLRIGPVDGALLWLHGAGVAEGCADVEAHLVGRLRAIAGPVPIVVAMDLHGNPTARLAGLVDGVVAYETNPHVDEEERSAEAARMLAEILDGTLERPSVALVRPPLVLPTIRMRTNVEPMREIMAMARSWEERPGVRKVAVFGGWPLADVPHAGPSVAVTATDDEVGARCANAIAGRIWDLRQSFCDDHMDPVEAVAAAQLAAGRDRGPAVIADVADNITGGGTGDATDLVAAMVGTGASGAIGCICDPQAVSQARAARGRQTFTIGGRVAPDSFGAPVTIEGTVAALSDGVVRAEGPTLAGRTIECGPSARIDAGGLKLIVTSRRVPTEDRSVFRMLDVQPETQPLVVVKSRGHFRADFEPIAAAVVEAHGRGATAMELGRMPYRNLRRPIWPLDAEDDVTTGAA
jgi:microcystin degradation protein MlrC